jgi:hypothetical protein
MFAVLLASSVATLLFSCTGSKTAFTPTPPAQIGDLKKVENPPADEQIWSFVQSEDSWSAAYADGAGEIRLRIFAFVFPDVDLAKTTYESSRVSAETGVGNYRKAGEGRLEGTYGLKLVDDRGEYYQYRHGPWIIVLSGKNGAHFGEAVRALRGAKS